MNIIVSGMIKDKRRTRTLPDPDPESIKDSSIRIRYNKKKPWIFEAIEEGMDE